MAFLAGGKVAQSGDVGQAMDVSPEKHGNELARLIGTLSADALPRSGALEHLVATASFQSLRALQADLEAFGRWCRSCGRLAIPATPDQVAAYVTVRAGKGAKPASLRRYLSSIARAHKLLDLSDPTKTDLVRRRLSAVAPPDLRPQRHAYPLRLSEPARSGRHGGLHCVNLATLLETCADDLPGLRDKALLSVAYDSGLLASELVALELDHINAAPDPGASLLLKPSRRMGGRGEGAPIFLSQRSARAIEAWIRAAGIHRGPLFRRVQVRKYRMRAAYKGRRIDAISNREAWDLRKTQSKPAVPARTEYSIGNSALHAGSIGPIFRRIIRRAFARGAFPDLDPAGLEHVLAGIGVRSTRAGRKQDLLASGMTQDMHIDA